MFELPRAVRRIEVLGAETSRRVWSADLRERVVAAI
jgi:hypothetical protein